jgi:hypothetical protein
LQRLDTGVLKFLDRLPGTLTGPTEDVATVYISGQFLDSHRIEILEGNKDGTWDMSFFEFSGSSNIEQEERPGIGLDLSGGNLKGH